jgi:methylated-DNA-[protein]-cysteine S-methyltransferase
MATIASRRDLDVALAPATQRAVFETELGWFAAAADDACLLSLVFAHRNAIAAAAALALQAPGGATQTSDLEPAGKTRRVHRDWFGALCRRLVDFASGAADDFADVPLFTARLSEFDQSVVRACRRIPYGATLSYGELAKRAGHAGAARGVGRTMATNRFPIIVPCHRVVAAGGRIGGYSAPQGLAMKRRLLALEAAEQGDLLDTPRDRRQSAATARSTRRAAVAR